MFKFCICGAILYLAVFGKTVQAGNVIIHKFEQCESEKRIVFKGNVTTKNDGQYLNADAVFGFALDNNYGSQLYVERSIDELTYMPGIHIREKNACKAGNKYLGKPWFEVEKAAGIQPGICPVPPVVLAKPRLLITSLDHCPSEKRIAFSSKLVVEGDIQYLDASITFPCPVDQNIGMSATLERAITDDTYMPGITVREKQACRAANKYLGQRFFDYEKTQNLTPNTCPIPAEVAAQSRSVVIVRQIEVCPSQNAVKLYVNFTTEGDLQYVNLDLTFPWPVDQNIGETVVIERSSDGLSFSPGITIREKQACKAANKYLGESWFAAERAAHIQPGVCPIPAGQYKIKHFLLDFSKVPVEAFPPGKLKITVNLIDKRNKKSALCLFGVAELVKK